MLRSHSHSNYAATSYLFTYITRMPNSSQNVICFFLHNWAQMCKADSHKWLFKHTHWADSKKESLIERNKDSSSLCISIQSYIFKKEQKKKKTVLISNVQICVFQSSRGLYTWPFWLNPHKKIMNSYSLYDYYILSIGVSFLYYISFEAKKNKNTSYCLVSVTCI